MKAATGSTLLLLALAAPASALNINVRYSAPAYASPPAHDPTGENLVAIVQAAADMWARVIDFNRNVTINVIWQELPSSTIAFANTTTLSIHVNSTKSFYFDPTPHDHSEFAMQQTLYRDLPANQQSWYNGSVPDVLEVGYHGNALATTPAEVRNRYDMLSIALHELGHIFSISSAVGANEASDGDYDFHPDLVGGHTMAARTITGDAGHLRGNVMLLRPTYNTGQRTLIGATDVFAGQSIQSWGPHQIDLVRKDMVGTHWNVAGDWIGNRVPDLDDEVFVRNNKATHLTAAGKAGSLLLANGSSIDVGAQPLTVSNTFQNAGLLSVASGNISAASLNNDLDGRIAGSGTLAADVINSGTIEPIGNLLINGDLIQTIEGILAFSLDIHAGVTSHGWIGVTGDATLAGQLQILLNGDDPSLGDHFDLFTFEGAVFGDFSDVILPDLSGSLMWDTSSLAMTGRLSVVPEPASLALLALAGTAALSRRRRVT